MASPFMVGESLVGEGNEVAHIDLLIGSKGGPVGQAFAAALLNQKEGHTNLLAVVAPNLPAKPDTLMANKVTIKGATQAVQMFGPAQAAVARAVVDSVRDGVIPADQVDDLCVIVGVFIHWEATDDKKIFDWNYQATKESIARALAGEPSHAGGPRRGGRGAAPVRRGSRGVATPDPTPQPCEPRLDGARAVVTGASSGIGAGIAKAFAGAGATVLVTYRRSEAAALAVADDIAARGGRRARRARRPRHARGLRGARRGGARAAGRPRRVGQQRRRRRAHRGRGRLGLGAQARPPARRRPQGHDRLLVRGRRRDARAGRRRRDREHELGPRHERHGRRRSRAVQRGQGRRARLQQEPGARARPVGAGQRPLPGLDRDRVRAAGRRRVPALGGRVDAAGPLGDARPTSPRRRCIWPRRRRHSSPARRSTSTVAL